jgi:hypothetical protein
VIHVEDPNELLAAARVALAEGDPLRVAGLWAEASARVVEPDDLFHWVLLLVEAGELELARAASARLPNDVDVGLFARAHALLAEADDEPSDLAEDPFDVDDAVLREAAPASDQVVVELFLRWFGGRRDLHARQWFDERRRRGGYRLVEQPLTRDVVRAHLAGRITVGQYLLYPDGSCSYGVVDLDVSSNALSEIAATGGRGASPLAYGPLRDYALRITDAAARLGLPLFPEDSGSRGLHLWLFLEPRRPARAVRALLAQVLATAGPQPAEVRAEVFPKQDRPGPKGLSSLVKLPLGLHQATMRPCRLLDERLAPIDDPLAALERLHPAPTDVIDAVLGRRVLVLPDLVEAGPLPALPRDTSGRSLAEALRAIEPGRAERDACEAMLAGCAVLRRIVRTAYDSRSLDPSHARALLYTIGLVGPASELAGEVFATAGVSRKELDRARAGIPSPTGCKKLRRLGLVEPPDCPCSAGEGAQPYATPALFAVGARPPAPPTWTPFAAWLDGQPGPAGDPMVEIAARLARIDERLEHLTRRSDDGQEPE